MQSIQIRLTKELINKAQNLVDLGIYSNKSEVIRDALRRLIFNEQLSTAQHKKFFIIYSSDLHGNIIQFKKLFDRAYEKKADAIIIGGDIAPKDQAGRTIEDQRQFLLKLLVPLIKSFNKKNLIRAHNTLIFIILGNDDFKSNYSHLKKYENVGFKLIHNKIVKLHEKFKIIGYSFVPLTPFSYKDWEKLDLTAEEEWEKRKGFLTEGIKSKGNKLFKVKFNLNNRKDTIENDLKMLFRRIDPKKIILVSHTPPYDTCLDMIDKETHVGSSALRKLIEKKQPYLTLHGHIHETVNISKKFIEILKNTISITSGNDNRTNSLAIIEFDLYHPINASRNII